MCVLTYLCTSAEASRIQKGEDVEANGPGQLPGKVLAHYGQFGYCNLLDKLKLAQSAPLHDLNNGCSALRVIPSVKLYM